MDDFHHPRKFVKFLSHFYLQLDNLCNKSNCSPNARCTHDAADGPNIRCTCMSGYTGDGYYCIKGVNNSC